MTPIQTRYRGYNFRSRLEARWAVFFDHLGVKWDYEVEGFDIDGTFYLPDFRLTSDKHDSVVWVEIKPSGGASSEKFQQFAKSTSDLAFMFEGTPWDWFKVDTLIDERRIVPPRLCPRCGMPTYEHWHPMNNDDFFAICHPCDWATASINDEERGLLCDVQSHKGSIDFSSNNATAAMSKIVKACIAARSARFEHGECGATL